MVWLGVHGDVAGMVDGDARLGSKRMQCQGWIGVIGSCGELSAIDAGMADVDPCVRAAGNAQGRTR